MSQSDEWKQTLEGMGTSQILHQLKINNSILEDTFRLSLELKSKRLTVAELVVELEKFERIIDLCNEKNDFLNEALEQRRGR